MRQKEKEQELEDKVIELEVKQFQSMVTTTQPKENRLSYKVIRTE